MKTMKCCLIAALAFGFPLASAYADDASYCEALSTTVNNRPLAGGTQGDASASAAELARSIAQAMAQCKAGNTAAGIPTLEKILKENKVTLPPRT